MSIVYPVNLDALTNPTSTTKENVVSHAEQHANANDAIEALEAKVGVDNSAVTTSIDYKLKNTTGGHDHDGVNSKLVYIPQQNHAGLSNLDYNNSGHTGFEPTIGHTTENVANKATSTSLGTSDTLYPTQNAVKTYVDTADALKEDTANKSTDGTFADNSDTKFPSQKAAKTYADTKISKGSTITSINETGVADGEVAIFNATSGDIRTSNVTVTTTLGTDDTTLPTSKAVKDVTDAITVNSYTWQGAWVTATAYVANDLVENDGSAYICTVDHTSGATTEPGVGADWEDDWDLMVQKGSATANTTLARAYLSGAQTNVADSTDTKVLLDAENYDIGSNFDTTNKRYVVPTTGYYLVSASVGWANTIADKTFQAIIVVNGSGTAFSMCHSSFANSLRIPISDIVYATAGQYIELYCRQNGGAATPDLISASSSTYMAISLLTT